MTKKKVEINSTQARQIIVKETEKNGIICAQKIANILIEYGFEQQATMIIGKGFIEPRIILVPKR